MLTPKYPVNLPSRSLCISYNCFSRELKANNFKKMRQLNRYTMYMFSHDVIYLDIEL